MFFCLRKREQNYLNNKMKIINSTNNLISNRSIVLDPFWITGFTDAE